MFLFWTRGVLAKVDSEFCYEDNNHLFIIYVFDCRENCACVPLMWLTKHGYGLTVHDYGGSFRNGSCMTYEEQNKDCRTHCFAGVDSGPKRFGVIMQFIDARYEPSGPNYL